MGTIGRAARPRWWREVVKGLALFGTYAGVTSLDWPGRFETSLRNSRALYELQRALHLDIELGLNRWLARRRLLRIAANYEYAFTYIVTTFVLLFWLYARRPTTYRWACTSFIKINLAALAVFAVYPLAPPRFIPELGYIDTVVEGRTWGSWGSPWVSQANQIGAMPSLHVAWALWVSLVLASINGSPWMHALSALHILVTLLVIMATANHYILDAVAGALLALGCVAWVRRRDRCRRAKLPPFAT